MSTPKDSKEPTFIFSLIVWIACFIIGCIGVNSLWLSPLLLIWVIAPFVPEYIRTKKLTFTLPKVLISGFIGLMVLFMGIEIFNQSTNVTPTIKIISHYDSVIQGTGYDLSLEIENADTVVINGQEYTLTGISFNTHILLEGIETLINIEAKNPGYSKTESFTVKRELNTEELEQQKLKEEADAEEARILEEERLLEDMADNPQRYIEVISNERELGGFDSVGIHNITLKNNSKIDYKDFVINATYYSASETKLSTATQTIYEIIPAGGTKTFKEIKFGYINSQSKSSNIKVSAAKLSF